MRYDKYDPRDGGFRAPLAVARVKTAGAVGSGTAGIGVGLDNQGRIVAGAGNTGVIAVLCLTSDKVAGDIIDSMTDGEVVEFGGVAGTVYYADDATGAISVGAAVGKTRVGQTVEGGRLIVRVDRGSALAATNVVGDQAAIADSAVVIAAPAASAVDATDAAVVTDVMLTDATVDAAGVNAQVAAVAADIVTNVEAAIDAATLDVTAKADTAITAVEAKLNTLLAELRLAGVIAP